MTETVCPLCGVSRPGNAKQCICNYTFEYERSPLRATRARATAGPIPLLVLVAIVAAIGVEVAFASTVPASERNNPAVGWLLIASGIFSACGGTCDWDFFMNNRKARRFVLLFGRSGARFFYAILGGALAGAGVALTTMLS